MTAPSPEAPPVPSSLEPRPEGPSPRWRRAAQGLRWMRLATYTGVTTLVLATLWSLVGDRTPPASVMAGDLLYALSFLAYVAFAAGLWRFGSLPTSTGAAGPARQSFMWLVLMPCVGLLVIFILPFAWDAPWARTYFKALSSVRLFGWFVHGAMAAACLESLIRALDAALRSLGEPPPVWAPRALGAYIALWVLSSVPPIVFWSAPRGLVPPLIVSMASFPPLSVLALERASHCAIALILASVMRRTERVLARQESPETAPR